VRTSFARFAGLSKNKWACDLSPHPQPFSQREKGAQMTPLLPRAVRQVVCASRSMRTGRPRSQHHRSLRAIAKYTEASTIAVPIPAMIKTFLATEWPRLSSTFATST
jgi:hypothetical protein